MDGKTMKYVVLILLTLLTVGGTAWGSADLRWFSAKETSALDSEIKQLLSTHNLSLYDAFESGGMTGLIVGASEEKNKNRATTMMWLDGNRKYLHTGVALGAKRNADTADVTAKIVEEIFKRKDRDWILNHPFFVAMNIINAHCTNRMSELIDPLNPEKQKIENRQDLLSSDPATMSTEELMEIWRVRDAEDLWFKWSVINGTNAVKYPVVEGAAYDKSIMIYYSPGCGACKHLRTILSDNQVIEALTEKKVQVYWWPIGSDVDTLKQAARHLQEKSIFLDPLTSYEPAGPSLLHVSENFGVFQQLAPEATVPLLFWADGDRQLQHQVGAWSTTQQFLAWLDDPQPDTIEDVLGEKELSLEEQKQAVILDGNGTDAYWFARDHADMGILDLQQVVIERGDSEDAYYFANDIKGANVAKLFNSAKKKNFEGLSKENTKRFKALYDMQIDR